MTLWISHRGVRSELDENTAGSFDLAVKNGYRHLETDLRLAKDGRIVLWHDAVVQDIHGKSFEIHQTGSEVLAHLSLPKGGRLLFFDEFCQRYAGIGWTLDIKLETGLEILRKLSEEDAYKSGLGLCSDIRLLLWNSEHIEFASRKFANYRRYASKSECILAGIAASTGVGVRWFIDPKLTYAITPRFAGISMFTAKIVNKYHSVGASIIAYLPETYETAKAAIELGFEEVLADLPRPLSSG